MPRIPILTESSDFTPEQRRVVDGILGRRGGRIPGPFRLALHNPAVTEVWHDLGEFVRLKSRFPPRLKEFTIILAARLMDCDYVFNAHAPAALKAGLPQGVVAALQRNERPLFDRPEEEAVYDYFDELSRGHAISDPAYARVKDLFGIPGLVELMALFGYYTMVAQTMLAHEMPLPEDAKFRLEKQVRAGAALPGKR
jgi:4-carboxymuconolactone decarboxylase